MTHTRSRKLPAEKTALHSAHSHTCKILCDYLVEKGIAPASLEQSIGTKLTDLADDESRVNLERYYALWEEAVEYSYEPDLALKLASRNVMEGMGLVGHVFFNCKTLSSAVEHYRRYYRLVNESVSIDLDIEEELAKIRYTVSDGFEYSPYEMEYTLVLAAERARRILQSGLDIRYVAFQHSEPSYAATYTAIFKCQVLFGQPVSEIAFDAQYLDFQMPRSSPSLYKILTAHLDRLLTKLGRKTDTVSRVEAIVYKKMSDPELDADYVATRLNMSRNTLYRHLKKENCSYHDIVDNVRSEFAIKALESGEYSVTELTFVLGFSEVSAFSRAFKRWTGKAPNAYCKKA